MISWFFYQLRSFLALCKINVMLSCSFFVFYNISSWQKRVVFNQDVFNTHGYKCTHTNIKILFLKIIISLLGHWLGRCHLYVTIKIISNKPVYLKVMKISSSNIKLTKLVEYTWFRFSEVKFMPRQEKVKS